MTTLNNEYFELENIRRNNSRWSDIAEVEYKFVADLVVIARFGKSKFGKCFYVYFNHTNDVIQDLREWYLDNKGYSDKCIYEIME